MAPGNRAFEMLYEAAMELLEDKQDGARALARVVDVARTLVLETRCNCETAWRGRDMHAPQCFWVELEELREAVAAHDATIVIRGDAPCEGGSDG